MRSRVLLEENEPKFMATDRAACTCEGRVDASITLRLDPNSTRHSHLYVQVLMQEVDCCFGGRSLTLRRRKFVFENHVKPGLAKPFAVDSVVICMPSGGAECKQTNVLPATPSKTQMRTHTHTHRVNTVLLHKGASFPTVLLFQRASGAYLSG